MQAGSSTKQVGGPAEVYTRYPDDLEAQTLEATGVQKVDVVAHGSAAIKAAVIRQVYTILSMQLLLTVAGCAFFMFYQPARAFALSSTAVFYVALFVPLGILLALHCYKDSHPTNMYLLGAFTLAEAYTLGVICAIYYQAGYGVLVLQALLLTAAVFVSLTTYVFVTKHDFSWMGAALTVGLVILILSSFMFMFFNFGSGARMVFSVGGALLFSGYILYDTSVILHKLGPDDYIVAAINLYLDIVNLFLYLLQILRGCQE